MPRYAAIGLVVASAGCFGPKSHDCSDGAGSAWVCPEALACAAPPTFCANPIEVGVCDGKPEGTACRTTDVPDGLCINDACQMCTADLEGCRAVGWNPMTTVPSDTFKVVYAAGSGDAWAGGAELAHYDGAQWASDATFPALSGGITITGISGTSSAHLFVGTNSNAIYHRAGGAWTSASTTSLTKAVWADGDDDAFAVGVSGDVERFDGSAWTPMTGTMTTQSLGAVWGTSASDVYAVGTAGTVVHYNGAGWTSSTAGTGALAAVWGSGPGDVYVGGGSGIFHSTDGATWTPQGPVDSVTTIWGSSATDVFAGTKAGGILHSDGSGLWVPLVSPAMVTSISGSGPADAFAASGSQILHYTGSCWSTPLSPPGDDFMSVWAASATSVFAVGTAGALDRFDGAAWAHDTIGTNWNGVWARAANDAYAVATQAPEIEHWDGSAWAMQSDGNTALYAVTGTSTDEYAVGHGLLSGMSGTWTMDTGFNSQSEVAIWLADDGTIFVAGDAIYTFSSGALSTSFAADGTSWFALWGTSRTDVFAAGKGGVIRHFDGQNWSAPMDTGTTSDLHGLWGTSDDDVFASGDAGTLLHYHAQLWSRVPPPTGIGASTNLRSVAGVGTTIFVVGNGGAAARLIESAP